jgi:Uma2 family endonuclease
MGEPVRYSDELPPRPDISHLITEDDAPVENWFQERQQRLLPGILYASWNQARPFLAAADVGLFHKVSQQAVVPDVLVSLDVAVPQEWWEKHNRSYMNWEFGKPPELALEVISNRGGGEDEKFVLYAQAGVAYYALYDPRGYLSKRPLRVYALHAGKYTEVLDPSWLEGVGLGLVLWEGTFEGLTATWLRWCDAQRNLLPTALERVEQERERAEQERERAEQERERAERLEERLRELGHDLD